MTPNIPFPSAFTQVTEHCLRKLHRNKLMLQFFHDLQIKRGPNVCLKSDVSLSKKSFPLSTTIILSFCAPHETLCISSPHSHCLTQRETSGVRQKSFISHHQFIRLPPFPEPLHLSLITEEVCFL